MENRWSFLVLLRVWNSCHLGTPSNEVPKQLSSYFILGGDSKITADSDCSHEIKRCLLLRRKAMTNLDSILKSRHYFVDKGPVAARTLVSTSTTSRLSLRSWSTRWSLTCMRHRHSLTASTLCMTSWWCTTKLTIPTAGRPDPPSHPLPQEGAGLTAVTTPTLTSQPQVFCPRSVAEALSPESVLGGRVHEVPQSKPMQSTQRYGFSSSHVWILELDYKESWAPKNCCFWTVVLEKTLESPLGCRVIQPVHPKGNQSEYSLEGLMLKLKLQYFGHPIWRTDSWKRPWC